uniref:Phospholysine phosphohistidine inorganic pyrophosphate phosphatase n=1 Tax=Geospiza parvula TaxID=87175 RepID=A0A8C3N9B7_GEOPR
MAERGRGWARAVRGLLLDVSGVLYDSGAGGGVPIAGSVEAVRRIKASGLKLQLCTNETQATRESFVRKLRALGFDISVAQVTAPAPAACHLLRERGLRPHLLVHHDLVPEFAEIDKTNPNCVVLGDAAENFTYANLNEAFRLLIGMEKPVLISLGKGRYYKETDGLKLDVGAYMKALEYACDIQAEVVGKPAKRFFESALAELGVPAEQAIMIGDDIVSDVGGAQQCGMRALQVRTGKFRSVLTLLLQSRASRPGFVPAFPHPFPLLST